MPVDHVNIAPSLRMDADFVGGASLALLGQRGSGKTYASRVLAEELLAAHVQTVILDPMGVFWGLRSSAAGTRQGLPIPVFGGKQGDAPLESSAGTLMADLAVKEGLSMILDLSGFGTRSQERAFASAFLDRLYRTNRDLLHLIVDEADLFAPQKPRGQDAPLLATMENIVRRGRNKGLGVTMATQRPAVLNKDVLTQVDVLAIMRITGLNDRQAIHDWVRGQGDETGWQQVSPSLPALQNGESWWWVPQQGILKKVQVRKARTFDSSPTRTRSASARAPKTRADVDLAAISDQIAATIERAKEEDPRELRARIRRLEKEAGQVDALKAEVERLRSQPAPKPVEALAQLDQEAETLSTVLDELNSLTRTVQDLRERLATTLHTVHESTKDAPVRQVRPAAQPRRHEPAPARQPTPVPPVRAESNGRSLAPAQQRLLNALANMETIDLGVAAKVQLAMWVGLSPKSGNYANILGRLRSEGLIDYPTPGQVALTGEGRSLAQPDPSPVITDEDLHQRIRGLKTITQKKWDILATLIEAYPEPMSKVDLAESVGLSATSGNYANILGSLRTLGLLDYPSPGQVVATATLFVRG